MGRVIREHFLQKSGRAKIGKGQRSSRVSSPDLSYITCKLEPPSPARPSSRKNRAEGRHGTVGEGQRLFQRRQDSGECLSQYAYAFWTEALPPLRSPGLRVQVPGPVRPAAPSARLKTSAWRGALCRPHGAWPRPGPQARPPGPPPARPQPAPSPPPPRPASPLMSRARPMGARGGAGRRGGLGARRARASVGPQLRRQERVPAPPRAPLGSGLLREKENEARRGEPPTPRAERMA